MHKIDGAGHVNNTFVNEDIATNRPPTELTDDWANAVQSEIVNVIDEAGVALDKNNNAQLLSAIRKLTTNIGVFNSVLKPTAAPTLSSPEKFLINNNGEVFMWLGASWGLVANGHSGSISQSSNITLSSTAFTQLLTLTLPRAGQVLINSNQYLQKNSGSISSNTGIYTHHNGVVKLRTGVYLESSFDIPSGTYTGIREVRAFEAAASTILDVAAGDVIIVYAAPCAVGANVVSVASADFLKYKYLK